MYEYHGWATIYESASGADGAEQVHAETIERLRGLIRRLEGDLAPMSATVNLRCSNGLWHLWFGGLHNHERSAIEEFYRGVAREAPGSYGVLYTHNDHLPEPDDQQWFCHVMARGTVREERDSLLSPHIPTVESPWDGIMRS